jgi:hypothetical protein
MRCKTYVGRAILEFPVDILPSSTRMLMVASYQKLRIWLISATPYNKTYLIYEDSFLEWVTSLELPSVLE